MNKVHQLIQIVRDVAPSHPTVCPSTEIAEKHAANLVKLLEKLRASTANGQTAKTKKLTNEILKSYSAKLTCLIAAYHSNKPLKSGETLSSIATSLSLFHRIPESVFMWAEPKTDGGMRPLMSFGIRRKAAQLLCAYILQAHGMTWSYDYLCKGRGNEKACQRVYNLAKEENYDWFVIADIKNCFQSLKLESVQKQLPLPEDVIRNVIYVMKNTSLSFDSSLPVPEQNMWRQVAYSGLPQGSPASGLIASWLVGRMLSDIGVSESSVLYGDDIAIAARDEAKAKVIKDALLGAAITHPCGPLAFKHINYFHVEQSFNFTKYKLRRLNNTKRPLYSHCPSLIAFKRFKQRYVERYLSGEDHESYAQRWLSSFPLWKLSEYSNYLFAASKEDALLGLKKD